MSDRDGHDPVDELGIRPIEVLDEESPVDHLEDFREQIRPQEHEAGLGHRDDRTGDAVSPGSQHVVGCRVQRLSPMPRVFWPRWG